MKRTLFKSISLLILLVITQVLPAKELETVSLQLLWKHQFQFAGYYVAKEKGFYEDAGLDVEIREYRDRHNPAEEVLQHHATYGIGRSTLIIGTPYKRQLKLLAAILQSSPMVLISLRRDDLQSVRDFGGKTIMMTHDAIREALYRAMMKKSGISNRNVTFVPHSGNLNDLIDGKVDLMEAYLSNEPFLLDQRHIPYTIYDPREYGFDFYSDVLLTSAEEFSEHPERTRKFKEASLKGWRYAFAHIDETVDLLSAASQLDALPCKTRRA